MSTLLIHFTDGHSAHWQFPTLEQAIAAARVYARICRVSDCLVWEGAA